MHVLVSLSSVVFLITDDVASLSLNGLNLEVLQVIKTLFPNSYALFFWLLSISDNASFVIFVFYGSGSIAVVLFFDLHPMSKRILMTIINFLIIYVIFNNKLGSGQFFK